MKKVLLLIGLMAILVLIAACGGDEPPQVVKETVIVQETVEVEVVVTKEVEVMVEATAEPSVEVPFEEAWAGSGHADAEAEAFRHWDEDDPAEVPANCAKCHSTPGMQDFLGVDGSEFGVVNNAAPLGSTVECVACHNDVTLFPRRSCVRTNMARVRTRTRCRIPLRRLGIRARWRWGTRRSENVRLGRGHLRDMAV